MAVFAVQPCLHYYHKSVGMSRAPVIAGVHFTLGQVIRFVLFRNPPFIHDRQFPIYLSPVPDWHCPFFVASNVARYKAFSNAWSLGNTLPLSVQLPVSGIKGFNGIRRIDHCPDLC